LTNQIITFIENGGEPNQIAVLSRVFSQLTGIESQLLKQKIPYRVLGQAPFLERNEIKNLLKYITVVQRLRLPVDEEIGKLLLDIVNIPNRMIPQTAISMAVSKAISRKASVCDLLSDLTKPEVHGKEISFCSQKQREKISELLEFLCRAEEILSGTPPVQAGDFISWMVETLGYLGHFTNYFGPAEESLDRQQTVKSFIMFASQCGMDIVTFTEFLKTLDPTCGVPLEQQILFTTVYRAKGLQFDMVIIPDCVEGYMPCLKAAGNPTYDISGIVTEPELSDTIENERRLFYVAITRAKQMLLIGTVQEEKPGYQGVSSVPAPSRFIAELEL
jgi:DNA helicase-2/ATP-dependent DNA helicase PcrA